MGPVNWLAVVLASLLAMMIGIVWYGPMFRVVRPFVKDEPKRRTQGWFAGLFMFVSAAMLGHMYARIGSETLGAKPWLYFMQSGGIAIAFVIPAIWMTHYRLGAERRTRLVESGYYLVAYLAMGAVFWALA
jgi:hypothetical protein